MFSGFEAVLAEMNDQEQTKNRKEGQMTTKEYLSLIEKQERAIEDKELLIETLYESLSSMGISYDKERVQSSPDGDKFGKTFAKIDEQEKILQCLKDDLIDIRLNVINLIESCPDATYRKLLLLKYVKYKEFRTLKDVADAMGYSHDYVKELHGEALKSIPYPT